MLMGEISYSVYLLQFWILTALSNSYISKAPPEIFWFNPAIKITAIIVLTTLIAYGSYYLFEMPCRKYLRKLLLFKGPLNTPKEAPETLVYDAK
jgi:peptidoglycan/LPS O-acetylase OafA/YrhL